MTMMIYTSKKHTVASTHLSVCFLLVPRQMEGLFDVKEEDLMFGEFNFPSKLGFSVFK